MPDGRLPLLPAQRAAERDGLTGPVRYRVTPRGPLDDARLAEAAAALTDAYNALRVVLEPTETGTYQLVRSVLDAGLGEGGAGISVRSCGAELELLADPRAVDRRSVLLYLRALQAAYTRLAAGGRAEPAAPALGYAAVCAEAERLAGDGAAEPAGPQSAPDERPVRTASASRSFADLGGRLGAGPRAYKVADKHLLAAALIEAMRPAGRPVEFSLSRDLRTLVGADLGLDLSGLLGSFDLVRRLPLADPAAERTPAEQLAEVKTAFGALAETASGAGPDEAQPASDPDTLRVVLSCLNAAGLVADLDLFEPPTAQAAESARTPYDVELRVTVYADRVDLDWTLAGPAAAGLADTLPDAFAARLSELLAAADSGPGSFVPADFPLAVLSPERLDEISRRFPHAEDVYRPGPFQRHLIGQHRRDKRGGLYVSWIRYTLNGLGLDIEAFAEGWRDVARRHATLRTSFLWTDTDTPMSVVNDGMEIQFAFEDLSALDPEAQQAYILAFCDRIREYRLDLERAPLWALTLLRTGPDEYQFVARWTYMLQDGWSYWVFMDDFLDFYEARQRGEVGVRPTMRPYRDHIRTLEADRTEHDGFWRDYLRGATLPTPILSDPAPAEAGRYRREGRALSRRLEVRLRTFARSNRLTVFTLFEAGWAAIVSALSGSDDVVIGVISSGRTATLRGVQTMAGSFNNNLPVRVALSGDTDAREWLQQVQSTTREVHQHEQSALPEIQAALGLPRDQPLFNSYLVFENFPPGKRMDQVTREWTGERDGATQTEHQIRLLIWPFGGLAIDLSFYENELPPARVRGLIDAYFAVLEALSSPGRPTVADVVAIARGHVAAAVRNA